MLIIGRGKRPVNNASHNLASARSLRSLYASDSEKSRRWSCITWRDGKSSCVSLNSDSPKHFLILLFSDMHDSIYFFFFPFNILSLILLNVRDHSSLRIKPRMYESMISKANDQKLNIFCFDEAVIIVFNALLGPNIVRYHVMTTTHPGITLAMRSKKTWGIKLKGIIYLLSLICWPSLQSCRLIHFTWKYRQTQSRSPAWHRKRPFSITYRARPSSSGQQDRKETGSKRQFVSSLWFDVISYRV